MKVLLCVFVLFGVCAAYDNERVNNYWKVLFGDDDDKGREYDDGMVRPCSYKSDKECVRQFFVQNFQCSPAYGPAPDPVWIKIIPLDIPHVNITFTLTDVRIKGFNDFKIKEFYINKKTNTLVMEVVFDSLKVYSPVTVITYRRQGKEPIELADFAFIEYKDLSQTLTVSNIGKFGQQKAHVYTYINDPAPKNGLGPNFTESKDPLVMEVNTRLIANIGLSLKEAFVRQGPMFMSVYLQSHICDFNLYNH